MTFDAGIGGTLLPRRYVADQLEEDAGWRGDAAIDRLRRRTEVWWAGVAATCGPASGLRALFDLVAMPLFGVLGFRAYDAVFGRDQARVRLETRARTPVALVLVPWTVRPRGLWRDLTIAARAIGASWSVLLAPPFLSIVDARGHTVRRSIDFVLPAVFDRASFGRFWLLASAGAFDSAEKDGTARIEKLVALGARFQDRVREDLQQGVAEALGWLSAVVDPPDRRRRANPRTPATNGNDSSAFDEALTIVYRILFLLFAESRDLVPHRDPVYGAAYAVGSFCRQALSREPHPGLWDGLAAVTRLSRLGCRTDDLIVRPFNGHLFARAAAPSLEAGRLTGRPSRRTTRRDEALARALVALGSRQGPAGREEIAFADLGVEQLGAVYERVLDLDPTIAAPARPDHATDEPPRAVSMKRAHSARRKQDGTFYTPQPLAEFLVRRTLAPLVTGASADDVLALRVVDPAMGSGAFLVAACRYLAAAYERALVEEGRAGATDIDEDERADIRRLIAERCLTGVDRNPVAVQLARLSLWLTTLARGKPLGFLDHSLRVGNSLTGAAPDDLGRARDGRKSRHSALPLFDDAALEGAVRAVSRPLEELRGRRDESVDDVRAKERLWQHLTSDGSPLRPWRRALSLWCAQWFWPPHLSSPPSPAELRAVFDAVLKNDRTLRPHDLARWLITADAVEREHQFFHWPLEFPDVFYDAHGDPKPQAGFDAVIGNPPWEMLRDDPHDGRAGGRRPAGNARRGAKDLLLFVRQSGLYPSCDRGHLNLYQPFLERALSLTRPGGRVGLIVPWGLAADDGASALRRRLIDHTSLETLVGLDNGSGLFPIHRGLRFLAMIASPGSTTTEVRARFGVRTAGDLGALPGRDDHPERSAYPIRLTPELIRRVGGPNLRLPDLRRPEDLPLLERLVRRFPALGDGSGWSARFGRELNATDDRAGFGLRGLPVVEGKHLAPFRVDTASVLHHMAPSEASVRLPDGRYERPRLGYRDVSGVANRVTLIAAIVPPRVVTTHTVICLRTPLPEDEQLFLCALFNSYVLNAVVRLLMGGHLTTSLIEGLPVPAWTGAPLHRRILRLAQRLSREPGSAGANAFLQADVGRLYELDAREFRHVLDGFPLVAEVERDRAARAFAARASCPKMARAPRLDR